VWSISCCRQVANSPSASISCGLIHGDHALRDANLHRSKPDAGRGVHRLEHVVDERAQFLVEARDRLRAEPQFLVGDDEDVAEGHCGDLGASAERVKWNAAHPSSGA
jgi:hypothetical protein